ncbi:MAG: class I SAM-dependent methyltransferase [Candidatus Omnitrophota bacterium]
MKKIQKARECQYDVQFETIKKKGAIKLGPTASHLWRNDPRHVSFLLARYKFCAKMLAGKKNVLEIGCGDAFGTRLVLQTAPKVHAIDFDPLFINWARKQYKKENLAVTFQVADITKRSPVNGLFDGAYALDFIEHIKTNVEKIAMNNICKVLAEDAVFILGTPNITAKKYAGIDSRAGHVNLKTADDLRSLLGHYFKNVFIFSMNDEVVHTGFYPMANYLLAVTSVLKKKQDNHG